MTRVLLTGLSGVGKSTLVTALRAGGHRAVDTDDGWCETANDGEWIWNEAKIATLLHTPREGDLWVAGCASNQVKFRHLFELVVLLSAPRELLIERIQRRTENTFGQTPEELATILRDLDDVEPRLRASADVEVRTDRPVSDVMAELLALADAVSAAGPRT